MMGGVSGMGAWEYFRNVNVQKTTENHNF